MIKHIYRSKLDIENLSRLRTSISNEIDKFDYKKLVVNKPWGYEYLMFENNYVAIWVLFIKKGFHTSMHCHPLKKTSLFVLSGRVRCSTLEGWDERAEGDGLILDEAVFHTTKAISKNGAFVMEIETPPNKKDLVRLKDEYGREGKGYEGTKKMSKDFAKYRYVDFHDFNNEKQSIKSLGNLNLSISYKTNPSDIQEILKQERGDMIALLQGKIHDAKGNILLAVGESIMLTDIVSGSKLVSFGDICYLTIGKITKK